MASSWAGAVVGSGPLYTTEIASYLIGLTPEDACFEVTKLPARCKAKFASSLCTRYTYAARKQAYLLTGIAIYIESLDPQNPYEWYEVVDAFLALPTWTSCKCVSSIAVV